MSLLSFLPFIGKVLDRVIPDKNARAVAQEALETMDKNGDLELLKGQLEVNKVEAAHKSIFVAGWRPFVGWTCGLALFHHFLVTPILGIWFIIPAVEIVAIYPVLMGILGLRTYEKKAAIAREK